MLVMLTKYTVTKRSALKHIRVVIPNAWPIMVLVVCGQNNVHFRKAFKILTKIALAIISRVQII